MQVSATLVKELRDKTGAGILDCKEALTSAEGDMEQAVAYLRKKGLADAKKRAGRTASEGLVGAYVHMNGKIGVLVEVNSETDFVARTDEFQELVKNLAMQVAASSPRYLKAEDIPPEEVEKEKEIFRSQARESGKPEKMIEKIAEGKFKKHLTEVCLLDQPYIRDSEITIGQLVQSVIAKLGENIEVRRFVRFQLGEAS
jgi:elongation factor Ts